MIDMAAKKSNTRREKEPDKADRPQQHPEEKPAPAPRHGHKLAAKQWETRKKAKLSSLPTSPLGKDVPAATVISPNPPA